MSRTFFILFSSFFRNPVAYHSQQQFIILSELSVHVKQFFIFLNFFSEIRVAFVRRNSRKFYQDYSSMSSIFSSFLKKEVPSHSLRWNFSIALSFFSCQPVFERNLKIKWKKFLTNRTAYDRLNKLSERQERKFFWKYFR